MKVLTGVGYTKARLAGILAEAWVGRIGRIPVVGDTLFGEGTITNNAITGDAGLIVDTESEYFGLSEPHLSRLVDVVSEDGWMDTVVEQ